MSNPKEIDNRVARTEVANFIDASAPRKELACWRLSARWQKPSALAAQGCWQRRVDRNRVVGNTQGWIFITSLPAEREALRPLQSLWIDMLVLRLLNERKPTRNGSGLCSTSCQLAASSQFHTALTENRKSNNPIIMGFQGKAHWK